MKASGILHVLGISFNNINPTVVNFHATSTLELHGDEWSASSLTHFIPRKKPQYPSITSLGVSCSWPGCFGNEKNSGPSQELNYDYFVIQPITQSYLNNNIPYLPNQDMVTITYFTCVRILRIITY
jgi:hypothetical protein